MLLVLILVSVAQAANLNIDDSVEGQITLTHDGNWEGGVVSNGTPFGPSVSGSTTVPSEGANFSGTYFVNTGGNPDPGTGIIYFVDPANVNLVSGIIIASWSTVVQPGFDIATIFFQVVSSACGQNLGPLPAAFTGQGVPDPVVSTEISALFRDLITAAPVVCAYNLTTQFVGTDDTVCDDDDGDDD
jgi:hypothetical protein